MGVGALARVQTGWTGTAVLTSAAVSITVTPLARESVASFVVRLLAESSQLDATFAAQVDATGAITLSANAAFDLTVTGTVESRTAWNAGPYSGVTSVTSVSAYSTAVVPAVGMRLRDPLLALARTAYTGDNGYAVSPWRVPATTTLTGLDTTLELPDTSGHDFDYWHDGRLFGRFTVTGVRRIPLSTSLRSATTTRYEFDVTEVT